jgi:hypothetical protein
MRLIWLGMVAENKRDLARRRGFLQHRLDVVDETHAQHFVGFVEDECIELRKVEGAAFQMIDHATGRADDDMCATL